MTSGEMAVAPHACSTSGPVWHRVGLAGVLGTAAVLNCWRLSQNGWANTYYAAAVRSMSQNWHAFFFASLDPAGFVTVDKPPLALWAQVAAVRIGGFNAWSLLLPQALFGVLSVALLHHLVARRFGVAAGLLAGLTLAVTPAFVAVNRDNLPDSLLVLLLLAAAGATLNAMESGRGWWLATAGALVGLGFTTKMLAAFIVVPALWLAYLLCGSARLLRRLVHLLLASAVLVAVSSLWMLAVDAVPANSRPYVGGSSHNSVADLAFGYNGLGRIDGGNQRRVARDGDTPPGPEARPQGGPPSGQAGGGFSGQAGGGFSGQAGGGFRDMSAMFGGPAGPLRLLRPPNADQASWLLLLAGLGGLAALAEALRTRDRRLGDLLVWGGWLGVHWVVFSFARGIFHSYYLSALAPGEAALVGIGAVVLWGWVARGGWRAALAVAALLADSAVEVTILRRTPAYAPWLVPALAVCCLVATAIVAAGRVAAERPLGGRTATAGVGVGLAALLIAPALWSSTLLTRPTGGPIAVAGPLPDGRGPGGAVAALGGMLSRGAAADPERLRAFLESNRHGERFLVATTNAMTAAPLIIETGQAVMAMGGFSGRDRILTPQRLAGMIDANEVRWFLLGPGRGSGDPGTGSQDGSPPGETDLFAMLPQICTPVDEAAWGGPAQTRGAGAGPALPLPEPGGGAGGGPAPGRFGPFGPPRLYDCRDAAVWLRFGQPPASA